MHFLSIKSLYYPNLNNFLKESFTNKLLFILVALFPISILSGSLVINIFTILISCLTLFIIIKDKNFFFKDIFFYIILFFFISLIVNIFFNGSGKIIYERQIGILRFFITAYAIKYILTFKKFKFFNLIIKIWITIFLIVSFDILYEIIFSHNILGFESPINGRIASFVGDELKIGNFYQGFILFSSLFLITNYKNFYNYIFIIIFISLCFLIGERANFIKTFIGFVIFFSISNTINVKKKIGIFFFLIVSIFLLVSNNNIFKGRYYKQIIQPIYKNGITKTVISSHYGVHYYTAYKIFKNFPVFGIGLKQYRFESSKKIYSNNSYNFQDLDRWATHPHQLHFEFLSETGIFGYFSFLIFFVLSIFFSINKYLSSRNNYLLVSTIFLIVSFLPLIPSGSFFTTYTAAIFWTNYGVMLASYNFKN